MNPAVLAVAHAELVRRWRSLVALGVLAGVVTVAVVGAAALARRTDTAYPRLRDATRLDDVRVMAFGPGLAERVAALPFVEHSRTLTMFVGRVAGRGMVYAALQAGPADPEVLTPVVVTGRAARDDDPHEIVIGEDIAADAGLAAGDEITLEMLTPEEVAQFDVGFGDPDGPALRLRIVGTVRLPPGQQRTPMLGGAAFVDAYGERLGAAHLVMLDVAEGTTRAEVVAAFDRLGEQVTVPGGTEEFTPLDAAFERDNARSVAAAARVLVGGLAVLAAVALAAGLIALAQAFARHHAAGAADQQVERALGLTPVERTAARVLPALVSAAVAALIGTAGSVATAGLEPWGALARLEPSPGPAPNAALIAGGAAATVAVVLALAAATAYQAGRGDTARTAHRGAGIPLLPVTRRASVHAGLALAAAPGRAGRLALRSSLVGVIAGTAGGVAALTFGASLDRLVATPERYGWVGGDLAVIDATDEILAELVRDRRVVTLAAADQAIVRVDGAAMPGYSFRVVRGATGWAVVTGRAPWADDEITVGTRVARDHDVEVGDTVVVGGPSGPARLRVVGIGLGPTFTGEALGSGVLLTPDALARLARSQPFTEAVVGVTPGLDAVAVAAELGERYEVEVRSPPTEVANLAELGQLPSVLATFLGAVAVAALVHALVLIVRRRGREVAVLRAMGFTPAQVVAAVATAAAVTVAAGLLAGVPLGLVIGRLVWWIVADATGVATDVAVPAAAVAALPLPALAGAALVATLPGLRAARLRPAALLRSE